MVVKELIEYLQKLPQDAIVAIYKERYEKYNENLDFDDEVHFDKNENKVRFQA